MTTHSTEYRAICNMVAERLGPAAHDVESAIRPGGVVFSVPDESGGRWTYALEIHGRQVRQPITAEGGGMSGERFTGRGWHRRIAEDVAGRLASILAAGRSGDSAPTHTLKLDRLRAARRWTAIGPTGRLGDYDDAEAAVLALREAGATSVALSVVDGPDVDFTPTIEQVAEALGEPFAHIVPQRTWAPGASPGAPSVEQVWWYVYVNRDLWSAAGAFSEPGFTTFSGPTRADALRAAWAYITSQQEPTP